MTYCTTDKPVPLTTAMLPHLVQGRLRFRLGINIGDTCYKRIWYGPEIMPEDYKPAIITAVGEAMYSIAHKTVLRELTIESHLPYGLDQVMVSTENVYDKDVLFYENPEEGKPEVVPEPAPYFNEDIIECLVTLTDLRSLTIGETCYISRPDDYYSATVQAFNEREELVRIQNIQSCKYGLPECAMWKRPIQNRYLKDLLFYRPINHIEE